MHARFSRSTCLVLVCPRARRRGKPSPFKSVSRAQKIGRKSVHDQSVNRSNSKRENPYESHEICYLIPHLSTLPPRLYARSLRTTPPSQLPTRADPTRRRPVLVGIVVAPPATSLCARLVDVVLPSLHDPFWSVEVTITSLRRCVFFYSSCTWHIPTPLRANGHQVLHRRCPSRFA